VRTLPELSQMDAVDWLSTIPAASVDLVVTDPPYESLEKHRAVGTTTRLKQSKSSSNPWFRIFPNTRFADLFAEIFRVLAPNAHFYLFTDPETAFVAKPAAEMAGFKFWKPIIWDKQSIGMGYHYRARYEMILFFEKGKRRLNSLATPDVLSVARVRGGYPAEKPPKLSEILIGQSTAPGQLVVDPFMGSGSCGVAALNLGRRFRGNDIADESLAIASERLGRIGQPEVKREPGLEVVELDGLARREQERDHIGAEAVPREHHQARDRPGADILNRRGDLLFGGALDTLELALEAERAPGLSLGHDDVDPAHGAPDTPGHANLRPGL
jgi:site-specific DNA-methyltransferase (adenine-specific)